MVNESTCEVYGHVISVDAFGEAYVVPIQNTLRDIRDQLRVDEISLPTREDLIAAMMPPVAPTQEETMLHSVLHFTGDFPEAASSEAASEVDESLLGRESHDVQSKHCQTIETTEDAHLRTQVRHYFGPRPPSTYDGQTLGSPALAVSNAVSKPPIAEPSLSLGPNYHAKPEIEQSTGKSGAENRRKKWFPKFRAALSKKKGSGYEEPRNGSKVTPISTQPTLDLADNPPEWFPYDCSSVQKMMPSQYPPLTSSPIPLFSEVDSGYASINPSPGNSPSPNYGVSVSQSYEAALYVTSCAYVQPDHNCIASLQSLPEM